ncbi:MAG: anhydro-N-acetylmuramic acid kinase, partial [Proteobacteria bacterium]|nr:anhydro-N-acetylmuramic acid kinase [Pseudomonadota bacterium]
FTAAAVARGVEHLPLPPERWIVTGGGRRNGALLAALRGRLNVEIAVAEDLGWDGDGMEAEAFAFLAVRSLAGLPLSLPETTGVARPVSGGALHRAATRG